MTPEQQDIEFLADRATRTGSVGFDGRLRDTGMSSNSMVALAYGVERPKRLASDTCDLASVYLAFERLPDHRKTNEVLARVRENEDAVRAKYPDAPERAKAEIQKAKG